MHVLSQGWDTYLTGKNWYDWKKLGYFVRLEMKLLSPKWKTCKIITYACLACFRLVSYFTAKGEIPKWQNLCFIWVCFIDRSRLLFVVCAWRTSQTCFPQISVKMALSEEATFLEQRRLYYVKMAEQGKVLGRINTIHLRDLYIDLSALKLRWL